MFTHSPTLHPNPLIGSLQLLMWLLLHPTAWCNYIKRIAPELRPDFTLVELTRHDWQNRAVQRLLIAIYGIWPILVAVINASVLWLAGRSLDDTVFGTVFGMFLGLAAGLISGSTFSVAAGLSSVALAGICVGIGAGMAGVLLDAGHGVVIVGTSTIRATLWTGAAGFFAIGVVSGVAANIATLSLALKMPVSLPYSWTKRLGSFAAGILMSAGLVLIAVGAARSVAGTLVTQVLFDAVYGLLEGAALGIVFGTIIGWRTRRWMASLFLMVSLALLVSLLRVAMYPAVTSAVAHNVANSVIRGISGALLGMLFGLFFSVVLALPFVLIERIAGPWAGASAGTLGGGGAYVVFALMLKGQSLWPIFPLSLLCIGVGLSVTLWLPLLLYPFWVIWSNLLFRWDQQHPAQPLRFHLHPAFWDEHQRLPWPNLAEYLVFAVERNPIQGHAALNFLSQSRQRWAAQAAQVELDARLLAQCSTVQQIQSACRQVTVGELLSPAGSLLRSFGRIGLDLDAALAQESSYNQRLVLLAVEDRLDGLLRELLRSAEPYAVRFQPVANLWRQVVAEHVHTLSAAIELRQEIDSPYVIGVPLTAQQEIFVGRSEISARIEQLLLDRRHPPLLLYGQRRMGKTSLLNNLGRLLPSTIVPFFVDMQGPVSLASDYGGFLYNLARSMVESARRQCNLSIPPLSRATLQLDPFTAFDEWLDQVEAALGECTALLALDEFEVLDSAIAAGRFSEEAILGTLRHLIQHRTRFKVLLTGSHAIEELHHWANYLINVQVVHIGYLKAEEARQLIERPVKDFMLRYETAASQRVLALTRGHPALTQLLCYEIVALKNQQPPNQRRLATVADVEAAVASALVHGSMFFSELENGQLDPHSAALLRLLAAQGEGARVSETTLTAYDPAHAEQALKLLLKRELIEPIDGGYRCQVELIRRWFIQ
ncbi:MAG: AAA family ATPase [Chloroflexi bacterium]|nr:AAA family ATPase [Chloroflexota bacterium]